MVLDEASRSLGRTDLVDRLAARIGAATATGTVVVVEGEPGIGKTRLLADLTGELAGPDIRSVVARGYDIRPFGPLLDAFGVTPPAPVSGRRSPLESPGQQGRGVVDLLVSAARSAANRGPILVVVDDLHRADPGTLGGLGALLGLAEELPVSLLLARRPVPDTPELRELLERCRQAGGPPVRLAPLDGSAIDLLVSRLLGARPGPRLQERLAAAAGNPFLAEQLVAQSRRAGVLVGEPGVVDLAAVSPGVPDPGAVLRRMVDLSERPERLLRVLALLDGEATYAELVAGTGYDVLDLVDVVGLCRDAGVVTEDGDTLRVSHELVREAVESTLSPAAVPLLRRDLGHRLLAAAAAPARAAAQFLRSGDGVDAQAAILLTEVACSLVERAPSTAADLYARAATLAEPLHPARAAADVGLLDALFWSGRLQEALDHADLLRAEVDPARRLAVEEVVLRCLTILGRPTEALARAQALPRGPHDRAWTEALTAAMAMFALELGEAQARASAALEASTSYPDPLAEVLAWSVRAWVLNLRGYHAEAVGPAAEAVRLADTSSGAAGHRMAPRLFHGLALESAGASEDAAATLRRGLETAERLGTTWAVPFYHYAAALRHWNAGSWADAEAECRAGLAVAAVDHVGLAAPWAHAVLAGAALYQANLDAAGEHLDEGERVIAAGGVQIGLDWLAWMRALHLEARGDRCAAYDLLEQAWGLAELVHAGSALTLFGPDLVRISLQIDRPDTARRVLEAMETGAGGGRDNVDAHLDRCRGLVLGDADLIARARAVHQAGGRPVEALLDDEAAVLLLLRARVSRPDVDRRLHAVIADCEASGLRLVADRLRARDLQRRPGRKTRSRGAGSGWDSLTATEMRVVALVAAGQSNATVADAVKTSVRSVESHLYRSYAKLGVQNRTELALAYARRSPTARHDPSPGAARADRPSGPRWGSN